MRYPAAPAYGEPTTPARPAAPISVAGGGAQPTVATKSSSVLPIIVSFIAVLLLVGAGLFIVFGTGDEGDADPLVTSSNAPADTAASTSAAVEETSETTVETTTAATDTTPSVPPTAPNTGPSDPAAVPPLAPEPGPVNAPGSPQVLTTVQPSGPTYAEVETAFQIAQRFGDALALEDWDLARQLSPELADNSDDDFARGYANTNRVSLILRDARLDEPGYELLVVSVAVENGGDQTSLFCLNWAVDPNASTVDRRGGRKLVTWEGNAQPEAIRNDPAAMDVVNSCTYA